jgi:ribosomal protein L24
MILPGDKVRLKACHDSGQPGTVIRVNHGKLTVYWHDMDYFSRHSPDSLMLADAPAKRDL